MGHSVIVFFVIVAFLGVLVSLALGLFQMGFGKDKSGLDTEPYMVWRVISQAVTLMLMGIAAAFWA